jgi:WD40 repeat protein
MLNLDNLAQVAHALLDANIRTLAFSPDDQYIALLSLDQSETWWNPWRLNIINIESGERIDFPEFEHIWSLAWSPDGTKLAGPRWPGYQYNSQAVLRVYVYGLTSGEINTFLVNSDFPWGSTKVKVPIEDWIANFSLTMGGLEPCLPPP